MPAILADELAKLGLQDYLARVIDTGYDTWQQLCEISEDELAMLNVRLGDRRKLQRALARFQRWPDNEPLPSAMQLKEHVAILNWQSSTLSTYSSSSSSTTIGAEPDGPIQPTVEMVSSRLSDPF